MGDIKLSINRFDKLGAWYMLALSIIATVAIVGQVLIQNHLKSQLSDSRVVNVAGKQRMLSQSIAKEVLLIRDGQTSKERSQLLKELKTSLRLWTVSQNALLHGNDSLQLLGENSPTIIALFKKVEGDFNEVSLGTQQIIALLDYDLLVETGQLQNYVQKILDHEDAFLVGMEDIVHQYADEGEEKVSSLGILEYVLLAISLLVITVEFFFIFRPTARHVNVTVNKLIDSEKNANNLSKEIGALYASLEKSYEQISIVNQPTENPRLYAKADRGGNVTMITDQLAELSGIREVVQQMRLCDLFPGMDQPSDWMDEVVESISEEKIWKGELHFYGPGQDTCWVAVIVTPVYHEKNGVDELLLMGTDITHRKAAEQNMNIKNRSQIEKKINQQKFRSVLILEGQEEERKRIAMDIHDGIGQMLSSLKFQIESIDLVNSQNTRRKMEELSLLIKQIIKEVRRVTFNLKPTVLGDYGLQAALKVFIHEIGKLTDIKLVYTTEGEIERLPQKIENNIFRIIQEAINNAIKYSGSDWIETTLVESDGELRIEVKDEGKGFDTKIVETRNTNIESGRGFFNMYERTEYVSGNLSIQSSPGKGTQVVLTVPVRIGVLED